MEAITPPKHRAVCELHSVACSTLKMKAIYSSETSSCLGTTQRCLFYPEDGGDILLRNVGLFANYTALPALSRKWRRYTTPKHRSVCELHSVACSIMKMEAIYSSETSGCLRTTQRCLFYPEDGGDILRNIGLSANYTALPALS
jgi:hypothetical protein